MLTQDRIEIVDMPQHMTEFVAVTILVLIGATPLLVWMFIIGRAASEVREFADDWMSTRPTPTKHIRQLMDNSDLETPNSSGGSMP